MKQLYARLQNYKPYNAEEAHMQQVILDFMNHNENVLLRKNRIAHFSASAWITNKERTKILMGYHNIYKSWGWLGGHADGKPDLLFVARKEIEADERDEIRIKPDENSGVAWVPIEEVLERISEEHMKPVYSLLNEKLLHM